VRLIGLNEKRYALYEALHHAYTTHVHEVDAYAIGAAVQEAFKATYDAEPPPFERFPPEAPLLDSPPFDPFMPEAPLLDSPPFDPFMPEAPLLDSPPFDPFMPEAPALDSPPFDPFMPEAPPLDSPTRPESVLQTRRREDRK
jgi:hypothetical protein